MEQYEVRGLVPGSLYEVAVRAFTRAGPGPLSSPRIVDSTSPDGTRAWPGCWSCGQKEGAGKEGRDFAWLKSKNRDIDSYRGRKGDADKKGKVLLWVKMEGKQ